MLQLLHMPIPFFTHPMSPYGNDTRQRLFLYLSGTAKHMNLHVVFKFLRGEKLVWKVSQVMCLKGEGSGT